MGDFSFTVLNWISGWYYTLARATAMMDNDRYLRERTDANSIPVGVLNTEQTGITSAVTLDVRFVMNGSVMLTWTAAGKNNVSEYSNLNFDVSTIPDGPVLVVVEARQHDSGNYIQVGSFRFYKKQDHGYASFWCDIKCTYEEGSAPAAGSVTVANASLVTHREQIAW
ncbi:MAG TPA: hypothetical protein PLU44_16915 [Candidatus Krumholzibacteria bacterium]|nr:hypothetical protein [Candidatus Krumholzibacteria bacterium]